ncbi:MAG: hypothetical protein IKT98_06545 [Selenomonadaceae bacterium]|nr:hypothetical protein [Selenomonadaceae bacterium]
MIEIIETAWDRCTANGMSMFYLRKMVGLLTARQPVTQSKAKTKAWTPRTEARVKEALSKPSEVSEFGEIRDTEPKPWDKYSARGGFT